MKPEIELRDDATIAKLLASPVGRLSFVAVGGMLIFDAVNKLRAVIEMTDAWKRHVVEPARKRTLEELHAAIPVEGCVDPTCQIHHGDDLPPEKRAAEIDEEPLAAGPAGDPTSGFTESY